MANSHALSEESGRDRKCNRKYTANFRPKGGKAKVKLCGKSAHPRYREVSGLKTLARCKSTQVRLEGGQADDARVLDASRDPDRWLPPA